MANEKKTKFPEQPLQWLREFDISDAEIEAISDPEWIQKDLIIKNHITTIVAPANGGKSSVIHQLAQEWGQQYRVVYWHLDSSPADAKRLLQEASGHYELKLPDLVKGNWSAEKIIKQMYLLARTEGLNLHDHIWIFDTLKKFVFMNSKDEARKYYKLQRQLLAKGMTCINLAHTIKYRDVDGLFVYEGVADHKSDVDEMIYFDGIKNADGSMTISTRFEKVRGVFEPITMHLDSDRQLTFETEYKDVNEIKAEMAEYHDEKRIVAAITQALSGGHVNKSAIYSYCKDEHEVSKRQCPKVLNKYTKGTGSAFVVPLWAETYNKQNNRSSYSLIAPPVKP